jgi:hypothetical protein
LSKFFLQKYLWKNLGKYFVETILQKIWNETKFRKIFSKRKNEKVLKKKLCGKVSKKKIYAHRELADAAEEPVAVAAAPGDAPPGSPRGGACRGARRQERAAAPPEMSSPPGAGCSNLGELTAGPRSCFPWELAGRAHPVAAPPSRQAACSLGCHQPAVLFSQNKSVTSNQPTVLFSQNKPAPAISHQPTEQAEDLLSRRRKRRWERQGPGKKGSGAHPCVLLMTAERCGSFD